MNHYIYISNITHHWILEMKKILFPFHSTIDANQKSLWNSDYIISQNISDKPKLLLHICCAPDLSRPLHWLKNYFKLYLFWYNPNIHPKPEHDKRYAEFIRLFGLEWGDYEIVEDWYEPKEFFDAFIKHKDIILRNLLKNISSIYWQNLAKYQK